MKKIVSPALLSLFTVATSLLSPQVAKADRVLYCNPVTSNQLSSNSVNRSNAYANGYREGQQKARDREAYKPRTEGGEFARGFEDGYFNLRYTGQVYVPDKSEQSTTQRCNESSSSVIVTPPTVIYSPYPYYGYPYPYYGYPYYNYPSTFLNFNFGFGGWGRYGYGWGHRGWGRYGRW